LALGIRGCPHQVEIATGDGIIDAVLDAPGGNILVIETAIINLEAQNFMLPFAIKRLWRIFVIEKGGKF
jgi:hypothetical protein